MKDRRGAAAAVMELCPKDRPSPLLPPPRRRPRAHQANMANEQGSESWGKEKDQLSVSRSVLMSKTHFHACVLCLHTLDGRVPSQRTQVFIRYHFT